MICGVEDLIVVCKEKIVECLYEFFVDGKFLWEEVECFGVCVNVLMVQIGKDYYEDFIVVCFGEMIDEMVCGEVFVSGFQNGCYVVEFLSGLIFLGEFDLGKIKYNVLV